MIERAKLRSALVENQDWFLKALMAKELRQTFQHIDHLALAFVGVRRSGKTFSTFETVQNPASTLYMNFEHPVFFDDPHAKYIDELISLYTEEKGIPPTEIILDEIQNILGWEKWVSKAVELRQFKVSISGSSSKLLSSEIATSIAGRCIEKKIWPLSYKEYLQFTKQKLTHADQHLAALKDYMRWGAFPAVVLQKNEIDKAQLLGQYLSDIVLKDVIHRNQIRDIRNLELILIHYFSNISCLQSYSSLKKAYQMGSETAAQYTQALKDAFLFFEVHRYHLNLKTQSRDPKKIYSIDTGLRNVHARVFDEKPGRLAENIVYLQLLRQNANVTYFQEKQEVDFLIIENFKPKVAIQVCYDNLETHDTYRREVEALLECLKFTSLASGIILTLNRDEIIKIEDKEIKMIPLYRWLLGEL